MLHGLELLQRLAADALGRGIGRDEVGKLLFQVQQLVVKPVIFAVADGRLRQHVIGVVVPADFLDELGVAFFGCCVRHGESFNAKPQRSKAAKKRKIHASPRLGASALK